ncbi:MAG: transcription factor FapR [Ruminococcaceae bacterium]|nr:transcription factor FapR [Oscillospiraceae bacterium]
MARLSKTERQSALTELVSTDPFLTDEEIAARFGVSVPTVRLDRLELGIGEYRSRIREVAQTSYQKVRSIQSGDMVGELLDITPNQSAISLLETDNGMVFQGSSIVRGQFLYAMAETIAIAVIDEQAALVGIANIKYKKAVPPNVRLIAKAEVKRKTGNKYIVWVKIMHEQTEMFRGKFILVAPRAKEVQNL